MRIFRGLVCSLAFLGMSTSALADVGTAAFTDASDRSLSQASMFVGATFRLGLNGKSGEPHYRSALGISGMARHSGTSEFQVGQGLELALAGKNKPAVHLAGMDIGKLRRTGQLSGGAKTTFILVGALAAVGVAALVVVGSVRCEDEGRTCD